jgi:hypothetical protein
MGSSLPFLAEKPGEPRPEFFPVPALARPADLCRKLTGKLSRGVDLNILGNNVPDSPKRCGDLRLSFCDGADWPFPEN